MDISSRVRIRHLHTAVATAPALLGVFLGVAGVGCGDDPADPPAAMGAALSGTVRLTAQLTDPIGTPLGTLEELHADGVPVTLRGSDGSQRTAATAGGGFRFADLPPGRYAASVGVPGGPEVGSGDVELGGDDVQLPSPLTLESSAGLKTYPNPFQALPGLAIEYAAATAGQMVVQVLSSAQTPVWSYTYDGVTGLQHVHWVGTDAQDRNVPDGLYWVVVHADGAVQQGLVRKVTP